MEYKCSAPTWTISQLSGSSVLIFDEIKTRYLYFTTRGFLQVEVGHWEISILT